jgi:copper chaperone
MQQFKTNINCGSCVNAVRETLNALVGEDGWTVDINNASKLLTLHSDAVNADEVIRKLEEDGYVAKPLIK